MGMRLTGVLILAAFFSILHSAADGKLPDKVLTAIYISDSICIDGKLDEDVYRRLTPGGDFFQFHPQNGVPATFKTQVYACYDRKNLYFAFRCADEQPGAITADITAFGAYSNNDEISIYIDPFLDRRNYITFSINPAGIKKGEKTLWSANACITSDGWSAEFCIPFKSIRFPVKKIQEWGIGFSRYIFRLNETDYWTQVERDQALTLVDSFGLLKGIDHIRGGKNIEIFPYAGLRFSQSRLDNSENEKLAYGVDLKYGITSNLTLDLTSSPDYSEVESDPFFFQLNPFEVNLQENRPFYNEGSDYFATYFNLFYTRRIVNPTLAAKFTGKENGWSVGALLARDKIPQGDSTLGVIRLKRDIFRQSTFGVIYSSVNDGLNWNRNGGFDFNLRLNSIYRISGMAAFSSNKMAPRGEKGAGMFRLFFSRQKDVGLTFAAYYQLVEPGVFVPLGYIDRVDYQRVSGLLKYSFRWENCWLEQIFLRFFKLNETSANGELNAADTYEFMVDFFTRSRWRLQISHGFGDARPQIFRERRLVWDTGYYPQRIFSAELASAGRKAIQFTLGFFARRDFVYAAGFTVAKKGESSELRLDADIRISPQLQTRLSYKRNYQRSDDDSIHFQGNLCSASLNYQFSRRIASFIKFQYDSHRQWFQYDFLLGYEPANVSKIYFSFKNYSEHSFRLFDPQVRSLTLKISYLLRI